MKDFIILTEHPDIYSSLRFIEIADNLKLKSKIINPYDEILQLTNDNKEDLTETLVMHRVTGIRHNNFDLNYSGSLKSRGAKIINNIDCFKNLRDKEEQATFFHQQQIPTIPSFGLRKRIEPLELEKVITTLSKYNLTSNSDPQFIVKTLRGNQGIGTNLIIGIKSLTSILETFWAIGDQDFLIQPYLEGGTEFRVLLSTNKILGAINRHPSENEFRANSKWGTACKIKNLPKNILDFSMNTFTKSNATYAALDILQWQDQLFLIEINLVPGFKQMEEITQYNIAKEIITSALN